MKKQTIKQLARALIVAIDNNEIGVKNPNEELEAMPMIPSQYIADELEDLRSAVK